MLEKLWEVPDQTYPKIATKYNQRGDCFNYYSELYWKRENKKVSAFSDKKNGGRGSGTQCQSNEIIPIKIMHEDPPRDSDTLSAKSIPLLGISDNDDINKDAQFLEEINKVFDQNETSVKFTATGNLLENTYKSAQRELKKWIQHKK